MASITPEPTLARREPVLRMNDAVLRLGANLRDAGADFSVIAPGAEAVELCLFHPDGSEQRIALATGDDGHHSAFVPGVQPGQHYGYRVHGPWDPVRGLLHDPAKLLLDPFARAVAGEFTDHPAVHSGTHGVDSAPWVPRGVVTPRPPRPRPGPGTPWSATVVYETHVRGLTKAHPEVDPAIAGTFLGAAAGPIVEHLKSLGVTTVEFMPVAHHVAEDLLQKKGQTNYWGYSTLGWFAPHAGYATGDDGRQVAEFAAMVDAFHAAGLEVVLDVVFNHTAEGGGTGPILSMKGFANSLWYRLAPEGGYVDWTGTGNTVATSHPTTRAVILAALRWWSEDLGVDGFRFDLGVTLGRGDDGIFDPSNLTWLTDDPVVGSRKLIAEPWDLGPDGYRVGQFGDGWVEWNSRYRDDIRDVWRGAGSVDRLSVRVDGSPDIFGSRGVTAGVNLVTAHDGFTLADLVAYDHKHNEVNGEGNRDGHDDNRSWNSGVEGPTDDPAILQVRDRRAAALVTTLLISAGAPMLLGGDELGRSQSGNNNAYSIDDPNAWYDWSRAPLADLIARVAALRRDHPQLVGGERSWSANPDGLVPMRLEVPGFLVAFNPSPDDVVVTLPPGRWHLILDSSGAPAEGVFAADASVPSWTVRVFAAG